MNVYSSGCAAIGPGVPRCSATATIPTVGWDGEFLEYDASYDPWNAAIDAMCDHWSEWDFVTGSFKRDFRDR